MLAADEFAGDFGCSESQVLGPGSLARLSYYSHWVNTYRLVNGQQCCVEVAEYAVAAEPTPTPSTSGSDANVPALKACLVSSRGHSGGACSSSLHCVAAGVPGLCWARNEVSRRACHVEYLGAGWGGSGMGREGQVEAGQRQGCEERCIPYCPLSTCFAHGRQPLVHSKQHFPHCMSQ